MSKQKDSGPAFPMIDSDINGVGERYYFSTGGMSLRDWFAGQVLAGSMAGREDIDFIKGKSTAESFAREAYLIADAMIEEREKQNVV